MGAAGRNGANQGDGQGNAAAGAAFANKNQSSASGADGAAAGAAHSNRNQPNASGADGAAAGAAYSNKNQPNASGAEGAAAGATAANRNQPNASGAQGAAAGAAAANRNQPNATGAQGAAAGAAYENRNQPNASGAEGAAAGAAYANRNQPQMSGAQGAAAGAAYANQNQPQMSGVEGAAAYAGVRDSYDHPDAYSQNWYGNHPAAWSAPNWSSGNAWNASSYDAVASHIGATSTPPVNYGYGDNVNYADGNVNVNGQSVGTAAAYSQQAADLAANGYNAPTADSDNWLPLGVFGLVRNEAQHPQLTLQLAVNNQGVLRGNYHDTVTDTTLPIHGKVQQETQRAAWTVGENDNFIMEAGVQNLTQGEAPTLIHKNGETVRWWLVRLPNPNQGGNLGTDPNAGN
ncbi:hypothetical protein SAMN05421753_1147 [Planctomicrobium piriforme]|uniref:Uncharacterized protein n=2 Tax=Planctomicrobium piriforme TaxID=1576369 RepID=A0A1I3MHA8_9PLAN|nr:hypothetical protein SAMN05421753_1147 [Planctomicrobium piriforme]